MSSARDAILDAIVARLGGIAVGGGWATAKTPKVKRASHPVVTLPSLPCALVGAQDEQLAVHGATGAIRHYAKVMRVSIAYWVEANDMDQACSDVVHDVELALADHTLGGVCDSIRFESNQTFISELQSPRAGVEFSLLCSYRIAENRPDKRV